MFLNIFCDEPLSVFTYVTAKPDTLSLNPLPAVNVKLSPEPKLVPSTEGVATVAVERINEPSASHLSVAKLYTIE